MEAIEWAPINECPLYWVSNKGQIASFKQSKMTILRPALDRGYFKVSLWYDDKGHPRRVHRLVAVHFCDKVNDEFDEVNHKDAVKTNNHHKNLEWGTHDSNMKHAWSLGLPKSHKGEGHGMAKLTNELVLEIRALYKTGNWSYPKLSRKYGISISSAQRTVKAQTWTHLNVN